MSAGRHSFKQNDAARLIRAAQTAGMKVTSMTLKDGTVTVLLDGEQPATGPTKNDLDTWMATHEDKAPRA
jgi:hypothetical protein